ncbi:oxygen sensor protein DosP [mine drainage metagenome]|uniref:Oxygen sensor protein DosP n=1 Tax=mine drainage metagenome TaxID=410659 RepID=A0A1J5S0Z1_9ZZZZ
MTIDLTSYSSAYDEDVADALRMMQPQLRVAARALAARMFDSGHGGRDACVLGHLSQGDTRRLLDTLTDHLGFVLSPDLTPQSHLKAARAVGQVHQMVGLSAVRLLESCHRFGERLVGLLDTWVQEGAVRCKLANAVRQRMTLEAAGQLAGLEQLDSGAPSVIVELDSAIREASNLPDLLNRVMTVLGNMHGVAACWFARPDPSGTLQIEAFGGSSGGEYVAAMQSGVIPLIQIRSDGPGGDGPTGRAWRAKRIESNRDYSHDDATKPWQAVGNRLGFRGMVSVPLIDEAGEPFAIVVLYSHWPTYFDGSARRVVLQHLQQVLGSEVRVLERSNVIPIAQRREYRGLVHDGAVRMVYQPVIDLRRGRLSHVEALARLCRPDGSLVSPGLFLPALGEADLLRIFVLGLEQVCADHAMWASLGLRTPVALNLPAEALNSVAYRDAVFDALRAGRIETSDLMLEILETQELRDADQGRRHLRELQAAGIRIAQDDLGSGYSSLLRLDRINFDEVKIDQGLVRSAMANPQRAMEFIYHLTRLAHSFRVPVTVEGLERMEFVEAVAILGADHGQGYGIARPMAPSDLPMWHANFEHTIDIERPRSAIGALAGQLLWHEQLSVLSQWPKMLDEFVEKPGHLQRYIERNGLEDSLLADLAAQARDHARRGAAFEAYAVARTRLVGELSRLVVRGAEDGNRRGAHDG